VKTYGSAKLETRQLGRAMRPAWVVKAEPYVLLRLKRLFQRIDKSQMGEVLIADSAEACRELLWFSERFPLEFTPRERLERGAAEHLEREQMVQAVLTGGYKPPEFDLTYPPREYQRLAASMLLRSGCLLLADDLGLGKTISAIATLTDQRTLPACVVTLTHLPTQWARELAKFAPNLKVFVCKRGTPVDLRAKHRGRYPDVVVLSYSKLHGWAETLAPNIRSVVFDEVQELRRGPGDPHNPSKKYTAAKHLADSATFRMGLSATPIYNYGEEMFPVMDALAPGAIGTREEFLREWCHALGDHHLIKDPKAFGTYLRDQGLMLRRTRSDVGRELPSLQRITHHVEADAKPLEQVANAAAELARIILAKAEAQKGDRLKASGELDWRLRQATGIAKAPYVADFVRMLVEGGERVLLYGWHREVYALLEQRLRDLRPVFFTGEETIPQKEHALGEFKAGRSQVLVMSLRSGAGVDGLQHHCRTVVFGELDWSPGVHEQCIGRVHRDGQPEPVAAYFLVADSGSDPVVASVLGLKREQGEQIRDPNAPLVQQLQVDPHHIKRLAEQFLSQKERAA
jgi:SNF2 family DNA or RNA helicase